MTDEGADEKKGASAETSHARTKPRKKMSHETTKLDERRNELLDKERLTDKQAAILAAFEDNPEASYADIADVATDLLPDDEGVTGSYAGEQIKQRRPDWFDDQGRRRNPQEMGVEASGDRTTQPQADQKPDNGDDVNERVSEEVQQLAGGEAVDMEAPDESGDTQEQEYDEERVTLIADWYDVTEDQARIMANAEAQTGIELTGQEGIAEEATPVGLDENEWLRLTAFLHLFADTDVGARHEEEVMDLAGKITRQALEQ